MNEKTDSKPRRRRSIVSDKIDKGSPAYRIVMHLGGLTEAAEIIGRNVNTVYGWLQRGVIPGGEQQRNVHEKAAEAGKEFPADWFIERAPAETAPAEAA